MRWVKRIVFYTILLTVALFAAINGQSVSLDLLVVEWELSLGILVILVLATGMALGVLIGSLVFPRRLQRTAPEPVDRSSS